MADMPGVYLLLGRDPDPRRILAGKGTLGGVMAVEPGELAALALCGGLSAEQLSRLATLFHPRAVGAGVHLVLAEQPSEVVYLIRGGTVKVTIVQEDGVEVILGLQGPGELVGEMGAIDRQGRSANVVTLEACTILWIERDAFMASLETMPPLTLNVLRLLSRRLRLANGQLVAMAALDVYGRVARQVLGFAQEYGEPADGGVRIPLRLTQGDLASLVGASRVQVNKVIVTYKRLRYLSIDPQFRITVLNREALAQRCR